MNANCKLWLVNNFTSFMGYFVPLFRESAVRTIPVSYIIFDEINHTKGILWENANILKLIRFKNKTKNLKFNYLFLITFKWNIKNTLPPNILSLEARYGVALCYDLNFGMIFYFIQDFSGSGVVSGATPHTHALDHSLAWKILVSIKNHPLTLVHNRVQVYAIPCFTGKYTGWKCTIVIYLLTNL